METIPPSHQSIDIIPYHYALISQRLVSKPALYWSAQEVDLIQKGDIFIYIDPDYDPDPSARPFKTPSKTHVGIVHEASYEGNTNIVLLDASSRSKGRTLIPKSNIGYSPLKLEKHNNLWSIEFFDHKPLIKYIYSLRIHTSTQS